MEIRSPYPPWVTAALPCPPLASVISQVWKYAAWSPRGRISGQAGGSAPDIGSFGKAGESQVARVGCRDSPWEATGEPDGGSLLTQ